MKRVLSFLLVLVLCLGAFEMPALAEDTKSAKTEAVYEVVESGSTWAAEKFAPAKKIGAVADLKAGSKFKATFQSKDNGSYYTKFRMKVKNTSKYTFKKIKLTYTCYDMNYKQLKKKSKTWNKTIKAKKTGYTTWINVPANTVLITWTIKITYTK